MRIGVDYYPEHWPRDRWETDARMMREAGISVVRLVEFSWSELEPSGGQYTFEWLDSAIAVLEQHGISVVMSTPTATPPKWLVDRNPDILPIDRHGNTRNFGSRRHYCPNNPSYIAETAKIVEVLARRYGSHPAVESWQIDNEFGNENSNFCFCLYCATAFRLWLRDKYETIDELNRRWGTVFWSQRYASFDEVDLPSAPQCEDSCAQTHGLNPSLMLDFNRFNSDSIIRYQNEQIAVLKKYTLAPVTTNMMGTYAGINYYKMAEKLDFTSWDNYINTQWGRGEAHVTALGHALTRSLKPQVPMWVMEQQSGPCGWAKMGDMPKPGQLRLWTWQAIAGGADTVVYFRWRPALFGTEQYWYGILNHDGCETRRYREIAQTGREIADLTQKCGPLAYSAEAAIIRDYESLWSHRIHSHAEDFSADGSMKSMYKALHSRGINAMFLSPECDPMAYKIVFAPAWILADESMAQRMEEYVNQGGRLVLTYRSGVKTTDNTMHPMPVPGVFAGLAGAVAEEFDPMGGRTVPVSSAFGSGEARIWCDVLEPATARTLAMYTGEYYAGKSAVTENRVGKGFVYYIGCELDDKTLQSVIDYAVRSAGIVPEFAVIPDGVEIHEAKSEGRSVWFVLNHNSCDVILLLEHEYTDAMTGNTHSFSLHLERYGVAVLYKK